MSKSLDDIQRGFANKSRDYWASMRTNIGLMSRSDIVDCNAIEMLREELKDILDSGILTYPHTLQQYGLKPGMSLDERKKQFRIFSEPRYRHKYEDLMLQDLAQKAELSRKTNWSWRVGEEAKEKQALGWHPFFVTLTIDPKKATQMNTDPKTIWSEGREFRKYIRRLVNIVCKELGHKPAHKPPYRPESDYVTYCGVIEHGKSREHHHGHFIIWLRAIPASWRVCPNKGIAPEYRTRNECCRMSTEWKWSSYDPATGKSLSPSLYFRSVGDVWETQYNFALPLKDGKPMKVSTPRIAGSYITKYLSKEHKEWHHRMKATRNLGMNTLKRKLRELPPVVVEALTWRAKESSLNLSLMRTHSVPLGLLRSLAKQEHYLNQFRSRQLDLKTLLTVNTEIFIKMLSSARLGARPDRMDSSEFYDWVGKLLPDQIGYSRQRLITAHAALSTTFKPEKNVVQHVKIGGNNIGA